MIRTKKILIALAVIGANMLHNMPIHTSLAAQADFEITSNGQTLTTGDIYFNNGSTTDTIKDTEETYDKQVKGNVNYPDGTESTCYNGNVITFYKGIYSEAVYGAFNNDSNNVTNNNVFVYGGEFTNAIIGGTTSNGSATGNTIIFENGTFSGSMIGGSSTSATAAKNIVHITGGTFSGTGKSIYGGYAGGSGGKANYNSVTINNGTFIVSVYGGFSNGGIAKINKVTICDGTFGSMGVYGGFSDGGNVAENEVTIKDGTFTGTKIYGGRADGTPVDTTTGNATQNIVTIEGGTFKGVDIYGASSLRKDATGNTVNIEGGNFSGNYKIYGGSTLSGVSSGNTVNIEGGNFSGNYKIYGRDETVVISDNTLNLKTAIGCTVVEVKGFRNVNFTLPAGASSEVTMLKVDSAMDLSGITFTTDLNGLTLTEIGDYVTLVKNVNDDGFIPDELGWGHYVLDIGGVKELVYSKGTPVVKGDYTIRQGNVKGESGTTGSYAYTIKGNTNDEGLTVTGGSLFPTSYSNNEIIIRRGEYAPDGDSGNDAVAGAYNTTVDAISNNTVKIYDGTFKGNIYGGNSINGAVSGNKVNIYGGTLGVSPNTINIYGGWSNGKDATGNLTNIEGGTFAVKAYIYGGRSNDGSVTGNKLNIENGTFTMDANEFYGGYSNNGDVGGEEPGKGNTLSVKGGFFSGNGGFYGGGSNYNSSVTGNNLVISDVVFGGSIQATGGKGNNADANNNNVEITSSKFDVGGAIYGGESEHSNSNGNKVNITGSNFTDGENFISGGKSDGDGTKANDNIVNIRGDSNFGNGTWICGGQNSYGETSNNIVTVSGGNFGAVNIYGGNTGSGTANNNVVNIEGGTFADGYKLYGGYATGTSTNNALNLKIKMSGKASEVGYFQTMNFTLPSDLKKDDVMLSTAALAVDNNDGTAIINVYAGVEMELNEGDVITLISANSINDKYTVGTIFGDLAREDTAGVEYSTSTAKVTIESTSIKLTMLDFYSDTWYGTTAGGFTRKKAETVAEGGRLDVGGAEASFAGTKLFYGGYSNGEGIEVRNNTVNITGGEFGPEKDIYGGYSESGPANSNMVNIAGGTFNDGYKLYGGIGTESSGNILNLEIKMGGKAAEVAYFQIMNFTLPSDIQNGETMLKAEKVTFDNTKINVDATNAVKLKTGDVITLIDADNAEGAWTAAEIVGAEGTIAQDSNKLTFTIGGGGQDDDEDKEKAPVEGVAAAAVIVNASADLASGQGMASLVANTAGGTTDTFGAMSAGSSKYKTGSHVDVDGWGVLVGAGKTKDWKDGSATTYGLFFEYGKGDFDTYNGNVHGDGNSENKGVGIMARHKLKNNTYYEGNIRFGKQETEWGESELGSYDTDSRYYGIMVGVGHVYPVGKNEIDVYGRYTYGHVGACDATLKDSKYHFDSVKSHRVRVGGKYNFKVKDSNAKPYVGLAWEHEFKGESRATISGVGEAPAPSMKGNTGILEVGCDWNVSKKWTVGLGANAYVGKRKGWDGMARVFYNF